MTVRDLIQSIVDLYESSEFESQSNDGELLREAKWLVEGFLFNSGLLLKREITRSDEEAYIDESIGDQAIQLARRRLNGEPLSQLISFKEFYSLPFYVNGFVLTPRPETELLVDRAIEVLSEMRSKFSIPTSKNFKILDLGTGSGCIGLSIVKNCVDVSAVLVDVSKDALLICQKNAASLGVLDRVQIIQTDLCTNEFDYHSMHLNGLSDEFAPLSFDIVVSNPPYIPESSTEVADTVKRHEPHLALFGGPNGLEKIVQFLRFGLNVLNPGGWIGFEIGWNQGEKVKNIFLQTLQLEQVQIIKDYSGHDRFVTGVKKGG